MAPPKAEKSLGTVLGLGRLQRRPELDALRGIFLVWMTLTHLPTVASIYVNQPFGFVSGAEGFIFLSVWHAISCNCEPFRILAVNSTVQCRGSGNGTPTAPARF